MFKTTILAIGLLACGASYAEAPKGDYFTQGGLSWMPTTFYKTWDDANSYCINTTLNGLNGWRLPTKKELVALYDSGAMKGHGWTSPYIWSSTPNGSGYHYGVALDYGTVFWMQDTYTYYVTCVH